jgi:hypothetical protein
MVEETPEGILIRFKMEALNANSIELPLREVRYTLSIDGAPVFSGVRSPETTLRRLGTQSFEFPATISRDPQHPLPTGKARYDLEGRLTYLTPGQLAEVLFDLRFRRPKIAFHETGTIDLTPPSAAAP